MFRSRIDVLCFIAVLVAFNAMAIITFTGSSSQAKSTSLAGTWKSADSLMTAQVTDDTIEIDMHVDDETSGLYWKGTMPTTLAHEGQILSQGDTAAMDASMLGSQDDTKSFVYRDGKLAFSFSILGTTRTVELER